MVRKVLLLLIASIIGMGTFDSYAEACELIHLKRVKEDPCLTPGCLDNDPNTPCPDSCNPEPPASLCWTGCPFKIANEQDTGKGRLIVKKGDKDASVQGILTFEKNITTGIEYEHTTLRTNDLTCLPPYGFADDGVDIDARLTAATPFPPCVTPDFKVKYVKPLVCVDQTFNCSSKSQKSLKVFHDWDAVDDLEQGISIVRDGATFSHTGDKTLNVWFEMCCGEVADFGSPGDPFELDTYALIRDPNGVCRIDKLREGARNSGDPLPEPGVDDCTN